MKNVQHFNRDQSDVAQTWAKVKHGFTLAEVLITLVIIGILASLLLPTMIVNIQKDETVSRLKKEYSILNQALILSERENGPNSSWDWGSSAGPGLTFSQSFDQYWGPYLSVLNTCSSLSACGYSAIWYRSNKTTGWVCASLNGALTYDGTMFLLKDGAVVYIRITSSTTPRDLILDINGQKGPNILGHDLFVFTFSDGEIVPSGITLSNPCPAGDNIGGDCAAKIIKSGWIIPDDYQW